MDKDCIYREKIVTKLEAIYKNKESKLVKYPIRSNSIPWAIWKVFYILTLICFFYAYNFYAYAYFYYQEPFSSAFYATNIVADVICLIDLLLKLAQKLIVSHRTKTKDYVTFLMIRFPYYFVTLFPWYLCQNKSLYLIKTFRIFTIFTDIYGDIHFVCRKFLLFIFKFKYNGVVTKISYTIT